MVVPVIPQPLFGDPDELLQASLRPPYDGDSDREQDHQYSCQFLHQYRHSADTFTAYRRDVERFLQWLWLIEQSSLTALERHSLDRFFDFCNAPPKQWICTEHVRKRFITKNGDKQPNPQWRPFVLAKGHDKIILSNNSVKVLMSILSSFFNYLIEESYILFNPVALMRQKHRRVQRSNEAPPIRRLKNSHWQLVLSLAEKEAQADSKEAHRALFVLSALYLMGLRIGELANDIEPKLMRHFAQDHADRWWFTATGKGNKTRQIPVNQDMLSALIRYRETRGLTRLPSLSSQDSLIENFGRGRQGIGSRMIRYIVTGYFDRAVEVLKQQGHTDEANALADATVHWLRHTSVSEQVKIRDTFHVQKDVGHSSSKTTDNYIDTFDEERHDSMETFRLKPNETSDT